MVHRPPALSVFDNLNAVAVLEVSDQALVAVQSSSMSVLTETAILIAMCKMRVAEADIQTVCAADMAENIL